MPRIAACIEYCGKNYRGWQRQKHAITVQEMVEKSVSKVADEQINIIASGRTDTGVHALGQIVHFDTSSNRANYEWTRGVNSFLPRDISMLWAIPVSEEFHARFGARERSYRYVICNRTIKPSYLDGLVTWHRIPLQIEPMRKAAEALAGKHDFSAYRAAGCQNKNPVKEVKSIELFSENYWIWLDITADGFLHHMVRNIVGVLTKIGTGQASQEWAAEVLQSRDRKQGGVTAAPDGLYFLGVKYDGDFALPDPPAKCQFW